jgi:hypothetical protein
MHHVAWINRLTRRLAQMLRPGGLYVAFDYVGPHRNQYPWQMWSAFLEFNETLPERYRATTGYAHLKTMLYMDPTEAIHSELQIEVMKRYFDIVDFAGLGGPMAYQILFQNKTLFAERHTPEGKAALNRILAADQDLLAQDPECSLFAFWVATPKKEWPSQDQMDSWQYEEDIREQKAKLNGGRYYPTAALEIIYNQMVDLRDEIAALKARSAPSAS